jgi:hypothetical protein
MQSLWRPPAQAIHLINSDLGAVWLADPRPECFADTALDVVFSQGMYEPAYVAWGFVLCCGFFALRANTASARFFATVRCAQRLG